MFSFVGRFLYESSLQAKTFVLFRYGNTLWVIRIKNTLTKSSETSNEEDISSLERQAFLSLWEMMSNLVRAVGLLVRCVILTVDSEWQNNRALRENCTECRKETKYCLQKPTPLYVELSNRGFRTFKPLTKLTEQREKKRRAVSHHQKKKRKKNSCTYASNM